jgi:dethiobiotin synthetase
VGQILFVTGTDTGAGKTLLTASLLHHLRARGVAALAMKPFCSGGTADVDLLLAVQGPELARAEANPFYFPEPVAPWVAARLGRRRIRLAEVPAAIRRAAACCDVLLVEGSGGLLAPLGEGYDARDIIARLNCPVLVAARNRLGVINHSRLTALALRQAGVAQPVFVLMDTARPDPSSATNPTALRELLAPAPVLRLPFLGARASTARAVARNAGRIAGTMRRLWQAVR